MEALLYNPKKEPFIVSVENNTSAIRKCLSIYKVDIFTIAQIEDRKLVVLHGKPGVLEKDKISGIYHYDSNSKGKREIFSDKFMVCEYKNKEFMDISSEGILLAKKKILIVI